MTNKIFLITGGSRGIGRGAAEALLKRGSQVMIADLDRDKDFPAANAFIKCDVSKAAEVDQAVAETVRRFGRLDGLFANAGMVLYRPLLEMDDEVWHKTLSVNLDGVFFAVRAAARVMATQGKGAIVVTSSVRAEATTALTVAYSASKGALNSLVTQAATELSPLGIRINAILPGAIATPMLADAARLFTGGDMAKLETAFVPMTPLGRTGRAAEVGEAVAFLLSDQASFITGAHLPVDGGLLTRLC